MPRYVTNPARQVTDPTLIKYLQSKGIDPNRVEFYQDYGKRKKGRSPYAKFYRGLGMNRGFMIASGLPMVDFEGQKVQPLWTPTGLSRYKAGINQFDAVVAGDGIEVVCINDQPTGIKKGDRISWRPELNIGGLIGPSNMRRLPVDPVNANYRNNVIAWDYGPNVVRRARLIEGRLHERWFVLANPGTDIRIKHNAIGKGLRLGLCVDARGEPLPVTVIGDEEFIDAKDLAGAVFPIRIGASMTFYPDAPVEVSSVDGFVYETTAAVWNTIRAAAGDGALDADNDSTVGLRASGDAGEYDRLYRGITLFDTSALPDDAPVTGASESVYGTTGKVEDVGTPSFNIYKCNPNSNTELAPGDYESGVGKFETTALAGTITFAAFNDAGYNPFVLNDVDADDFGYISKIGVTKLGIREKTFDVDGAAPAWSATDSSRVKFYQADKGTGFKPKLVVGYIVPGGGGMGPLVEAGII